MMIRALIRTQSASQLMAVVRLLMVSQKPLHQMAIIVLTHHQQHLVTILIPLDLMHLIMMAMQLHRNP